MITISSKYSKLSSAIDKEQNNANIAALVPTGLLFSTLVVTLDIVELVFVCQGSLEFSSFSNVSLIFIIIRTVLDTAAVLITCIILLYLLLCCKKMPECCKHTCKGRYWDSIDSSFNMLCSSVLSSFSFRIHHSRMAI